MPDKKYAPKVHVAYHKDGSLWAKGKMANGVPVGSWEWSGGDGTRPVAVHFNTGKQVASG